MLRELSETSPGGRGVPPRPLPAPTGLRKRLARVPLLLLALLLPASALQAQGRIAGTVVDAGSLRPLAGVQVVIQAQRAGTLTRADGSFVLENLQPGSVTLEALMVGYGAWRQEVAVGTTNLQIRLEQRAVELDALVVTGTPGAQRVRSLGNAVASVNAAQLQELATPPNLESLLSGAVAGVNVSVGGGEVGSGSNIRIRGASSISLSSQPLVYVDGVRVNAANADVGGGVGGVGVDSRTPPSRLNDISPEDIASIEVIKGPAAATLYGTEASNGVINIITKKGRSGGAPQFSLTMNQGLNALPMDAETYFPSTWYRCRGTFANSVCRPGEVVEFNVLREDRVRSGRTWFESGRPQGYAASLSGGTEAINYYFSLDWARDEGIVSYNWQNQTGGRANVGWQARDDLNIQFGLAGTRSVLRSASANQPITTSILWSCPAPGCEEGSGASAVDGIRRGYIGYLPEVLADSVEGGQSLLRSTYNATVTHEATSWLTHRFIWGVDWTETDNNELYRPISGVGHGQPQGSKTVQRQTSQFLSLDYSGTVSFNPAPTIGLSTSAGVQYHQKKSTWVYSRGANFPVPGLETVSAGALKAAEEGFLDNKTVGAYIQQQVAWRDRMFITGAVRGDDNSAFGQNYDFVLYPKLSGSWVISEEGFFQPASRWVNQLRLRAAWGLAGQQPDIFAALQSYQPATGNGGVGTLTPQSIGNPDVKPEVGEEIEAGFDASFMNERLGVEFSVYNQTRRDALVLVPVRPSTGFPGSQFRNIGEVKNKGFEIGLNAQAFQNQSVDVDLQFNVSRNENELVSLGGLPPQILNGFNPTTGWARQRFVEGFPLGSMFLKRVVSAEIQGSGASARAVNVLCEGGALIPGTTDISRGGGAPVPCAQAPDIFRGTPVPVWEMSGSSTVTLFSNLQLYAQLDYQGGHKMIEGNAAGAHLFFRNTRAIVERTDPFLLAYESLGAAGTNQAGLIDASFLKLRRVSATYTLPGELSSRVGANRLSMTVSAQNLLTLWQGTDEVFGYPIRDPEGRHTAASSTGDPGGLSAYRQEGWPPLRRFLFSVRATF